MQDSASRKSTLCSSARPDLRLEGACTDQPKSAIFSSPRRPTSRFSGLMSRWMTCLEWQYISALASEAMYLHSAGTLETRQSHAKFELQAGTDLSSSAHLADWPSLKYFLACSSLYSSPLAAYSSMRYTRDCTAQHLRTQSSALQQALMDLQTCLVMEVAIQAQDVLMPQMRLDLHLAA